MAADLSAHREKLRNLVTEFNASVERMVAAGGTVDVCVRAQPVTGYRGPAISVLQAQPPSPHLH